MYLNQVLGQVDEGLSSLEIPAGWGQGSAVFGGLVGSLIYQSMAASTEKQQLLRSFSLLFVGPAAPGEATLETTLLRRGKSVAHLSGQLTQGSTVVATALASFGAGRSSSIEVPAEQAPDWPAPESCKALPYLEGVTPEFTQRIEYRWVVGRMPFQGADVTSMGGWMRFREDNSSAGIAYLLSLIDAWPPAVLPMLKQPAPASSLSWSVELLKPVTAFHASDWWRYLAEIEHAGEGYAVIKARIWDQSGELVALSRQTVVIFA